MDIKIPISKNFYREVVQILSPIPPYSKLTPKEKDLIAIIIELYNELPKELSDKQKEILLLSQENKKIIKDRMQFKTSQVLENSLSVIRKKGVLEGGLHKSFRLSKKVLKEINFKFYAAQSN